jgi:chromosome segregation ATPase
VEEQALDIAKLVGTAAGAFVTAWLGLVRPLDKKLRKAMASPDDIAGLRTSLDKVVAELQDISTRIARIEERANDSRSKLVEACQDVKNLQEKLGRTVTDEEFASYVQATAAEVRALSERLGQATGAIEAWSRAQSGGR